MREVIIVSPDKIFIPENVEDFIENYPEIGFKENYEFLRRETKLQKRLESPENKRDLKVDISQSMITINNKDKTDKKTFDSDLTSGFRLGLPSEFKPDLPPDYKLNLSQYSERAKSMFYKRERESVKKDINLSKYIYSDFSNIRFTKKRKPSFRSSGARNTVHRGSASFAIKDYDITPWATKVVDKIQNNWIIPSSEEAGGKGLVGISVIIEKNGELLSVKIVNSSDVHLLDEAALKAIELSSPFPALPDVLPVAKLEAYFEFHYND